MRRTLLLCLVALAGTLGQIAVAEENSSATPVAEPMERMSLQTQSEATSESDLTIHSAQVACDGTVTIAYTASQDSSAHVSWSAGNWREGEPSEEWEEGFDEILLPADSTSYTHPIAPGYAWYLVTVPEMTEWSPSEIGNCNSMLTITGLEVDCQGYATIHYTASGEPPAVWLWVVQAGTAPEPGHRTYELDPAETSRVIPPPYDGFYAPRGVNADMYWSTPSGEQPTLQATCMPDPTPTETPSPTATATETPMPIDVLVQAIIKIIRDILAGLIT